MSHEPPVGFGVTDFEPDSFSGVARLFPLPAPSLYPRVVLPLHVFEERYRALMQDALDGDGLIAMAVLKPGWEPDYASRPEIETVACLGRIITHHRLEDGRYNLMLAGVARVRLRDEIEPPEAFRRAHAELLPETDPGGETSRRLHSLLGDAFRAALPHGAPPEPLQRVFEEDTPLGVLADLAAHALPLSREAKQAALVETSAEARAEGLLAAIQQLGDSAADGHPSKPDNPGFPPPFSLN